MEYIKAIVCLFLGIIALRITYKDGKQRKANFTTAYVMHFGGYIGGIGAILLGILMLMQAFGCW